MEWQSAAVQERGDHMRKLEIRPGVVMAYADDWFGEPWTSPRPW